VAAVTTTLLPIPNSNMSNKSVSDKEVLSAFEDESVSGDETLARDLMQIETVSKPLRKKRKLGESAKAKAQPKRRYAAVYINDANGMHPMFYLYPQKQETADGLKTKAERDPLDVFIKATRDSQIGPKVDQQSWLTELVRNPSPRGGKFVPYNAQGILALEEQVNLDGSKSVTTIHIDDCQIAGCYNFVVNGSIFA
jgi:hypothetical protein